MRQYKPIWKLVCVSEYAKVNVTWDFVKREKKTELRPIIKCFHLKGLIPSEIKAYSDSTPLKYALLFSIGWTGDRKHSGFLKWHCAQNFDLRIGNEKCALSVAVGHTGPKTESFECFPRSFGTVLPQSEESLAVHFRQDTASAHKSAIAISLLGHIVIKRFS